MSGNNNILSLLGLALRGGRLAVGEEPAALAAKSGQARLILLASDAAGNTLRRAEHLAQEGHCLYLTLPFPKEELGAALGRGSAAVTALTDTGLAAAVTERLALLDPGRYGEIAERMELKRRRAKERQSAPRRDPPPKREDHRPPKFRREGTAENRDRPAYPKDGRRSRSRDPGRYGRERPRDGKRRPGGKDRSCNGKPCGDHPRAERSHPPYESRSGGGRPQAGRGRPPCSNPHGGPGQAGKRPYEGKNSAGGHPPQSRSGPERTAQRRGKTGPGRPPQRRGKNGPDPRSGGGH